MVKIIDYNRRTSNEGKEFYALTLQGGIEIIKSANGSSYVTIRKCSLPTTFDEATCQSLLGQELQGTIQKVDCEPYEYVIQQTGEVVTLTHRFEYVEEKLQSAVDFTTIVKHSSNGVHQLG
jgi:hypothetical protein